MSSSAHNQLDEILRPLALTLPPEVWVIILKRLDYAELKKASRICKKLQAYIQSDLFDEVLFRKGFAKPQPPEGALFKVHPMLERVDVVCQDFDSMTILHKGVGDTGYKEYHARDYPGVLNEYATCPAASLVLVRFDIGASKPLSKSKGAKVGDVLRWIAKFWKPINLDRLGDHRFFEGWEEAVSKGQNKVELVSGGFGS
ncbi:hypothetical protein JCM11491_003771 [Sporobolomyces phaffii]